MPIRWVVNPVVETVGADGVPRRRPYVATLPDPGRPGKEYKHSTVIDTAAWCVSFVRGVDMAAVDADPKCIHLLEQDYEDGENFLAATPRSLGWTVAKATRIQDRLTAKGIDTSDLTMDTPLWQILRRLGQGIRADYPGPAGTWVA